MDDTQKEIEDAFEVAHTQLPNLMMILGMLDTLNLDLLEKALREEAYRKSISPPDSIYEFIAKLGELKPYAIKTINDLTKMELP